MVSYMYSLTNHEDANKGFGGMVRYVYSLTKLVDANKCFWRNGELYVQFDQA
jgi:hypothetical protein